MKRICLITTGQPSTNPRLVKEADALSEAGYGVHVIATRFKKWASEADKEFLQRPWSVSWCQFGEMASGPNWLWMRLRKRLSSFIVDKAGYVEAITLRAFHYVIPELTRLALKEPADLYIAHNLGALPAAAKAAAYHTALLGFDAEDYHRGEFGEASYSDPYFPMCQWVEERYMKQCDYVTAASDGIADAYKEVLSIDRPATVLNVFPLSERETCVSQAELKREKHAGTYSIYWFSQTIGPDRGLEDALDALTVLDENIHLYLRGQWAPGYEEAFMNRAARHGVGHRIHALPPVLPAELITRTMQHDVGLSLEQRSPPNRDLCLSNKFFTYLMAGIPFVATNTRAQCTMGNQIAEAVRIYTPGDILGLAQAIRTLVGNVQAREAAYAYGTGRYNWDIEKERFLAEVRRVFSQ